MFFKFIPWCVYWTLQIECISFYTYTYLRAENTTEMEMETTLKLFQRNCVVPIESYQNVYDYRPIQLD